MERGEERRNEWERLHIVIEMRANMIRMERRKNRIGNTGLKWLLSMVNESGKGKVDSEESRMLWPLPLLHILNTLMAVTW